MRQQAGIDESPTEAKVAPPPDAQKVAPPPAAQADAAPANTRSAAGKLTATMALTEPERTRQLEKLANSGEAIYLRARGSQAVRRRYGQHVLVVPPKPKPFTVAHAIHLLWYCRRQIIEVQEA